MQKPPAAMLNGLGPQSWPPRPPPRATYSSEQQEGAKAGPPASLGHQPQDAQPPCRGPAPRETHRQPVLSPGAGASARPAWVASHSGEAASWDRAAREGGTNCPGHTQKSMVIKTSSSPSLPRSTAGPACPCPSRWLTLASGLSPPTLVSGAGCSGRGSSGGSTRTADFQHRRATVTSHPGLQEGGPDAPCPLPAARCPPPGWQLHPGWTLASGLPCVRVQLQPDKAGLPRCPDTLVSAPGGHPASLGPWP